MPDVRTLLSEVWPFLRSGPLGTLFVWTLFVRHSLGLDTLVWRLLVWTLLSGDSWSGHSCLETLVRCLGPLCPGTHWGLGFCLSCSCTLMSGTSLSWTRLSGTLFKTFLGHTCLWRFLKVQNNIVQGHLWVLTQLNCRGNPSAFHVLARCRLRLA